MLQKYLKKSILDANFILNICLYRFSISSIYTFKIRHRPQNLFIHHIVLIIKFLLWWAAFVPQIYYFDPFILYSKLNLWAAHVCI